mgnify:CR=1 FL=1
MDADTSLASPATNRGVASIGTLAYAECLRSLRRSGDMPPTSSAGTTAGVAGGHQDLPGRGGSVSEVRLRYRSASCRSPIYRRLHLGDSHISGMLYLMDVNQVLAFFGTSAVTNGGLSPTSI